MIDWGEIVICAHCVYRSEDNTGYAVNWGHPLCGICGNIIPEAVEDEEDDEY